MPNLAAKATLQLVDQPRMLVVEETVYSTLYAFNNPSHYISPGQNWTELAQYRVMAAESLSSDRVLTVAYTSQNWGNTEEPRVWISVVRRVPINPNHPPGEEQVGWEQLSVTELTDNPRYRVGIGDLTRLEDNKYLLTYRVRDALGATTSSSFHEAYGRVLTVSGDTVSLGPQTLLYTLAVSRLSNSWVVRGHADTMPLSSTRVVSAVHSRVKPSATGPEDVTTRLYVISISGLTVSVESTHVLAERNLPAGYSLSGTDDPTGFYYLEGVDTPFFDTRILPLSSSQFAVTLHRDVELRRRENGTYRLKRDACMVSFEVSGSSLNEGNRFVMGQDFRFDGLSYDTGEPYIGPNGRFREEFYLYPESMGRAHRPGVAVLIPLKLTFYHDWSESQEWEGERWVHQWRVYTVKSTGPNTISMSDELLYSSPEDMVDWWNWGSVFNLEWDNDTTLSGVFFKPTQLFDQQYNNWGSAIQEAFIESFTVDATTGTGQTLGQAVNNFGGHPTRNYPFKWDTHEYEYTWIESDGSGSGGRFSNGDWWQAWGSVYVSLWADESFETQEYEFSLEGYLSQIILAP